MFSEAAYLSARFSTIEDQSKAAASTENLRDRGLFNPTKYFVEEVVTGVDETDLHRTWIKVVATRNTRERSSRLKNTCWRIWHLARKKKHVAKAGGDKWKKLSEAEKTPYVAKAEKRKSEYVENIQAYNKKQGCRLFPLRKSTSSPAMTTESGNQADFAELSIISVEKMYVVTGDSGEEFK